MRLPTGPDETPTYIINPTKVDFIDMWNGEKYIIPSRQIVSYPKYLADHFAKHIASKMAQEDGRKIGFEDRLKKAYELIYVQLES